MPERGGIFGDRFFGRAPAWHQVGTVRSEGNWAATQALADIDADFRIEKMPLKVETEPGVVRSLDNRFALMRAPTADAPEFEFLGIVGKDYEYVQNIDIANMVDAIREQTDWQLDAIGVLSRGGSIFYSLDAGQAKIAGEPVRLYYLINENRGNGRALHIAFTPVQVVCQNTLVTGLSSAVVNAALFHGRRFQQELEWRATTVAQMKVAQDKTLEQLEALRLKKVQNEQVDGLLKQIYVDPRHSRRSALRDDLVGLGLADSMSEGMLKQLDDSSRRTENWVNRLQDFRDAAKTRYQAFAEEDWGDSTVNKARKQLMGTAYALYSAVVETEDYRQGPATDSAVFGFRAQNKARAFKVLSGLPA